MSDRALRRATASPSLPRRIAAVMRDKPRAVRWLVAELIPFGCLLIGLLLISAVAPVGFLLAFLGGTILTAFSFNWIMNAWALSSIAEGVIPDHGVLLATDAVSLLIFVVITYGFGFFSSLLFAFLLDIDLLYACKVVAAVTRATDVL